MILGTAECLALLPAHQIETMVYSGAGECAGPVSAAANLDSPFLPAYVIYTSGSTGKPKGVLANHGGLRNMVWSLGPTFDLDRQSRVLQFASANFDASVLEVFPALAHGVVLCLADPDSVTPGPNMVSCLNQLQITFSLLSPSVWANLPDQPGDYLNTIASGGEGTSLGFVI